MTNVNRILWYQVLTALVLTVVGLWFEFLIGMSLLLGVTISTVGTGILALGVFGKNHSQAPEFMLKRFYIAEIFKIITVVTAFTIIFLLSEKIIPLAMLGAYFIAQSIPTALASLQNDEL